MAEKHIFTESNTLTKIKFLENNGINWKEIIKRNLMFRAAEQFIDAGTVETTFKINFEESWHDEAMGKVLTIKAIVRG